MVIFDFLPLRSDEHWAYARLRCPMCAHTWEVQYAGPPPPGVTYTAACGNCGREGNFTTPPSPA